MELIHYKEKIVRNVLNLHWICDIFVNNNFLVGIDILIAPPSTKTALIFETL
jgi:hypothetical protein